MRDEKGLTVPEAIISLVLIGLVIYIFFALFPSGFSMFKSSSNVTRALQIGEATMEALRSLNYHQEALQGGALSDLPADNPHDYTHAFTKAGIQAPTWPGVLKSATYTAEPFPDAMSTGLKKVTITIVWGEGTKAKPRTIRIQMCTLLASF